MIPKTILQVLIKLMAAAIGIYLFRWLNDFLSIDERALLATMVALTTSLIGLMDFGLGRIIQKFFTNQHDKSEIGNFWSTMFWLRGGTYVFSLLLLLILGPLFGIRDLGLLLGLYSAQFVLVFDTHYRALFDARGEGFVFSITDLIGRIAMAILIFLMVSKVFFVSGIWAYIFVSGVSYIVTILLDAFYQRKNTPSGKFDIEVIKSNKTQIMYLFLAAFLASIYTRSDILILNFFGVPKVDIGGYDNAFKLYEICLIIPGIMMPTIASHLKKQINKLELASAKKQLLRKYIGLSFGLGLACSIGIFLFGRFGLGIIGASVKYPISLEILPILGISFLFLPVIILISYLFVFFEYERLELKSVFAVAVFAILAYYFGVKNYGAIGAGIANVSLLGFDLLYKGYLFRKHIWNRLKDA
jgi:O-antigen/teichoic acid export membrane protein